MSSYIQIQEKELRDIHASLAQLTERLANVKPPAPARNEDIGMMKLQIDALTREINQVKSTNSQLTNSIKWLQHQNAELEHRLSHRKPEIEHVVASRAKFQKKLQNAYNIIRDLLGEGDLGSSSSSESSRHHEEEFSGVVETGPGLGTTNGAAFPASSESRTPRPQPETLPQEDTVDEMFTAFDESEEQDRGADADATDNVGHGADSSWISSESSSSQSDDPTVVSIHYNKPPGVSFGLCSVGLEWSNIAPPLGMEDSDIQVIESLASRSDFGVRLRILPLEDDIAAAFIYDPVFLEEHGSSYLIDWGFARDNRKMKQSILQMRGPTPSFHTFTFPAKLGSWHYIGALEWHVASKRTYWPTLEAKDRRRIVRKLSMRCGGSVSAEEIERMLDSGELEEIRLEVERADTEISEQLRRELEHQDQQVQTRDDM